MRIKTISVTYGRKFNLDDYESLLVEATAWADIDEEGEDPAAAQDELWAFVKESIRAQAMPVLEARTKRRQQALEATKAVTNGK